MAAIVFSFIQINKKYWIYKQENKKGILQYIQQKKELSSNKLELSLNKYKYTIYTIVAA